MLPPAAGLPGVEECDLDAFLLRYQRETTRLLWAVAVGAALIFSLAPLITVGIPLPAFWLPRAARERHADRCTRHPLYLLRQCMLMIKMIAGMCWGAHPRVRAAFGLRAYAGDPATWATGVKR